MVLGIRQSTTRGSEERLAKRMKWQKGDQEEKKEFQC
jgi:hypothetical protein